MRAMTNNFLPILLLILPWIISADDTQQSQSQQQTQQIQINQKHGMGKLDAQLRSSTLRHKKPLLQKKKDVTSLLFPGAVPESYEVNQEIPLYVELVESRKTQVPYEYYKLPVCPLPPPDTNNNNNNDKNSKKKRNLGQRLMGNVHTTHPLPYSLPTLLSKPCTPICHLSIPSTPDLKFTRHLVKNQYRVHFSLDGLPVLMKSEGVDYAVRGFPLGFTKERDGGGVEYFLYNHLRFTVYYNQKEEMEDGSSEEDATTVRITGFHVHPVSIQHAEPAGGWSSSDQIPEVSTCNSRDGKVLNQQETHLPLRTGEAGEDLSVLYSYEVEWRESEVKWADRWDVYLLEIPDNEVHYFAIVNSLMVALILCGIVAIILIRALKKDIQNYADIEEELQQHTGQTMPIVGMVEETGWKLLHGDVFRHPRRGRTLLSVAVGTGMQIGTAVLLVLLSMVCKLLNPMRKGQTLSAIVVLYVLSGSVAGYVSARLYKYWHGEAWKRTTFLTAAAFPGALVSMFTVLNFCLSFKDAASAVSIWTMVTVFLLWICVSTPLVFVGSFFGFRAERVTVPTKSNRIARFIPESHSWFVKFPHSALIGGILPFGSVLIEVYFIMGAMWLHQIYFIMGFATIACVILTLSVSTVSMVITYVQLCNEDYNWWWKSFVNCASTGFYMFLYSIWFLVMRLELVGLLPFMVYLTYMSIICFAFALYCGSVGMLSSFWFCRKIYGAVRID